MRARIERHQLDRARRVPELATLEEALRLPECLAEHGRPEHLLVVDCLTLWLTDLMMPARGQAAGEAVEVECENLRNR